MARYRLALNLCLVCIALAAVILACAVRSALTAETMGAKADTPAVHHVAIRPGIANGDVFGGVR